MNFLRKQLLVVIFSLALVFGLVTSCYAGVLMQGFYWDCGGYKNWYKHIASKAENLSNVGFTAIWFPPPSKADSGSYSMGYDVYDHYDLGEYNQKGTTQTRFGSRKELENAIQTFHDHGMQVYVDTVLNHMKGGDKEPNPNTGGQTWTDFDYPHNKFEKNYRHFHPNHTHNDTNPPYHSREFGEDICYYNDYNYMGNKLKEWSRWLQNTVGFDGYRLDYVKGIEPGYIESWKNTWPMNNSFVVGEYWDGDRDTLNWWVNKTGAHAFDFALHYKLKSMCNQDGYFDMRELQGAGLVGINPSQAVTFVENHDTDENHPITQNKILAYAYILTHEGYPTVFWKDYYNYGMQDAIDNLVWIHENLAAGSTSVLHTDSSLYIAQRNGSPGLVVGLNDSDSWKSKWVQTKWSNTTLKDYTGSAGTATTGGDGWVEISIPPQGYSVWSPK